MSVLGFWRGRRVFLTGHTGFKGAWLCKILEEAGAEVTGYALAPPTQPNLYDICCPRIRSVIGDIRDFQALLAAYRTAAPEVVIHMAAQPLVLQSYRDPLHTYETNALGTVNLLECARLTGSARSILNVTTDKVYFNCERSLGYREEERLDGFEPYANSKACSELMTACYRRSFFNKGSTGISTVRSGNVIGGGDFSENRLIPDCARAAAQREIIGIRNPASVRPYQHVLDTLFAYLLVAERQYEEPALGDGYNIGPNETTCVTSGTLADLFCRAWGGSLTWEHLPEDNPHESGLLMLNCSKIKETMGWIPRWDIRQSVQAAADWYKSYYDGGESGSGSGGSGGSSGGSGGSSGGSGGGSGGSGGGSGGGNGSGSSGSGRDRDSKRSREAANEVMRRQIEGFMRRVP